MLVLYNPEILLHETVELLGSRLIPALESPARIQSILDALRSSENEIRIISSIETNEITTRMIDASHNAEYVEHLRTVHQQWHSAGNISIEESVLPECFPFSMPNADKSDFPGNAPKDMFARSGYYAFDMSTGIMKDTYKSVIASAGTACFAMQLISAMPAKAVVFALCRPPGHHCDTRRAGGYCYMNNAVLAVEAYLDQPSYRPLEQRLKDLKVAILDIDFHHGNGTQSYFYNRAVNYISIHGKDEYPYYSGAESEHGSGTGKDYNHNFPLESGATKERYLSTLDSALNKVNWTDLEVLVVSIGFDTYKHDPLGSFDLDSTAYLAISGKIAALTNSHSVKCLCILEGGYVIEDLGKNFVSFCNGWK